MATKTYTPADMAVIAGAAIILDFESLSVEYDEDHWSYSVGSGGEATRTKNSNRLGTIKIEVPQTHESNLTLSIAAASDLFILVNIVDTNGSSIHTILEASIVKPPAAEYSKSESGTREWVFRGVLDVNIIGGN